MTVTDIAVRAASAVEPTGEMSVEQIIAQTKKIQQCMSAVMKEGEHFGVIPGTNTKPTLLKPGAEKLCLLFRLDPEYEILTSVETPERIAYTIRCVLFHIPTGQRVASGLGSCNSREKKYLRPSPKKCPQCGKEAIIKGKEEYGGGWLCYKKKDGCGAKFKDVAPEIIDQPAGLEDPADLANTILKMGCKRALVAAVLNGTAASDFFTQDLEDLTEKAAEYIPPEPVNEAYKATVNQDPPRRNPGEVVDVSPKGETATTSPAAPANGHVGGATRPAARTAADVKWEGGPLSEGQLKKIHVLRKECGGRFMGDEADARTEWRKILSVYRDVQGNRIESSSKLSKNQASHLIDRMDTYIGKTKAAHARMDHSVEVPGEDPVAKLVEAIAATGDEEQLTEEICSTLRVMQVGDIATTERASAAFALIAAWKTGAYEAVKARVIARVDP